MASTMRQVRPFSGNTFPTMLAHRTRVVKVHCSLQQNPLSANLRDQVSSGSLRPNLPLAVSLALGAASLPTYRALAEEVVAQSASTISAEDIEILAANSQGSGFESVFVSVLFGVVVTLLAIVTGGVAYMNISQFLDNRQEKEDREKAGKEVPVAAAADESKEADEVVSLKRASRVKKEKGKGFAASEFTSRR